MKYHICELIQKVKDIFVILSQKFPRKEELMFWENFRTLCFKKDISPTKVCDELGIAKSAPNRWKNGSTPNGTTLKKIAEFFGVSTDYFFISQTPTTPDTTVDDYVEQLRNRPEVRTLFSLTKNASKEDVERAVAIIRALKGTFNDG